MGQLLSFVSNPQFFLLFLAGSTLCCKAYLVISLIVETLKSKSIKKLAALLMLAICSGILCDFSWILELLRKFVFTNINWQVTAYISRTAWGFFILQYQVFFTLLQNLINTPSYKKPSYLIFSVISYSLSLYYFFIAAYYFSSKVAPLEAEAIFITKYYLFPLFIPTCIEIWKLIVNRQVPVILAKQLKIFVFFFIAPQVILEFINTNPVLLYFVSISQFVDKHILEGFIILSSTASLFYCYRRIIGLRFLGIRKQIESKEKFDFINDFKEILEQLSYTTNQKELAHITQVFFQAAFRIPLGRTRLYIRRPIEEFSDENSTFPDIIATTNKVESLIASHTSVNDPLMTYLRNEKIFIKDEIEFSNFYQVDRTRTCIINFLNNINADIFLPIYERQSISAYIIVENDARSQELFSSSERDEMLVFTSYVSNTINILKHGNLESLFKQEKKLKEALYSKHQEINQYKESMRSFLRTQERTVGILFYKARRFTYANQAAEELLAVNVNLNVGHPLTIELKNLVKKVQEFKSAQSVITKSHNGNKLVISAVPSLEPHMLLVLVYYPEISDIVKDQFNLLKDPSEWDYLLYLETTQSGRLINQLIPGKGETLLNFKIKLLATALSKKATLINMQEDDLLPTVELLHHVSLRQQLHVLKLTSPEKHNEIALKLFGINPIFEDKKSQYESLLEKLDETGTLFIQNIHFLSKETQHYLAEFISYGFFRKFKSDHKVLSNVRIICSTQHNLQILISEGSFSKALFNELIETSFAFPSIAELPKTEINQLVEGFANQAVTSTTFKNLLELTEKDASKIVQEGPLSLQALKNRVHQLVVTKSNKHNIQDTTEFDPAYHVSDPELAQAVRLGKKALKDPHIMALLWNKFKNQNKIATLLGVNRSSINRRCQQYQLYNK